MACLDARLPRGRSLSHLTNNYRLCTSMLPEFRGAVKLFPHAVYGRSDLPGSFVLSLRTPALRQPVVLGNTRLYLTSTPFSIIVPMLFNVNTVLSDFSKYMYIYLSSYPELRAVVRRYSGRGRQLRTEEIGGMQLCGCMRGRHRAYPAGMRSRISLDARGGLIRGP